MGDEPSWVFAAEVGATLPELMARLGHATLALIYLHARAERDHQLTDALSTAMALSSDKT